VDNIGTFEVVTTHALFSMGKNVKAVFALYNKTRRMFKAVDVFFMTILLSS
jgi:hypothetical protein